MPPVDARLVESWLAELNLRPVERAERDGLSSWDLLLDGRRRYGVRLTLILEPSLALVAWVHYAPALSDSFRKSYRQFLRWNDEFPFVKFALSSDERPVLSSEIPVADLDLDRLGLTIARLLATCDLLHEASSSWLKDGPAPVPATIDADSGSPGSWGAVGRAPGSATVLLDRYADELRELLAD